MNIELLEFQYIQTEGKDMDYIIASVAVTDEIHFFNNTGIEQSAGGAGIYAMSGIKIWNDNVRLVTGVGNDYMDKYGEWYRKNNLSMEGLIVKDEKTPHTVIEYFEDGERKETSLYGDSHFRNIEVTPEELAPYFHTAKGIYIFKNADLEFWRKVLQIHKCSKAKLMWEISSDSATFEKRSEVQDIAENLDIFSINKTEAFHLLHVNTIQDAIDEFKTWNTPLIFFRLGQEGAYMIAGQDAVLAESVKNLKVMDTTGGGNSSSGAVLYGYCENKNLRTIGLMGSISAAICISQYGVPEVIDRELRQKAESVLIEMTKSRGDHDA